MVEEEDRSQDRDPHFVRACEVEMHFNIAQEPLYMEIYRKNARDQSEHPDQAPAFTYCNKNPSVWTHFLGKNKECFGDCLDLGMFRLGRPACRIETARVRNVARTMA